MIDYIEGNISYNDLKGNYLFSCFDSWYVHITICIILIFNFIFIFKKMFFVSSTLFYIETKNISPDIKDWIIFTLDKGIDAISLGIFGKLNFTISKINTNLFLGRLIIVIFQIILDTTLFLSFKLFIKKKKIIKPVIKHLKLASYSTYDTEEKFKRLIKLNRYRKIASSILLKEIESGIKKGNY